MALTPEQIAHAKAEAAKRRAELQTQAEAGQAPATTQGNAQALVSGLRSAGEAALGAGADLVSWEKRKAAQLARYLGADDATVKAIEQYGETGGAGAAGPDLSTLTTPGIQEATDAAVNSDLVKKYAPEGTSAAIQEATRHQPSNVVEEGMYTAGNFLPMMLAPSTAPSKLISRAVVPKAAPALFKKVVEKGANVAVPAVATEGAGQASRAAGAPEPLENAIRVVTGFLTGGGLEAGGARGGFGMRRNIRQVVDAGPEAVKTVFDNLKAQGMTGKDAATKMEEMGFGDVKTFLADTGPNTVQQTARIQAEGGDGRGIIDPAFRERNAAINPALEQEVTATVGPREHQSVIQQALDERLAAGQQKQSAAHAEQVQPVDLNQMAADIDTQLKTAKSATEIKALETVRKLLKTKGGEGEAAALETTSEQVLKARQAIRDELYEADGKQLKQGLSPGAKRVFEDAYAKINEGLDPANPALREADAEIAQVGKEGRAFEKGQEIYENPRGAMDEVEFKQAFDALSPGEKKALASGVNVETWRQIGIKGNDLTTLEGLLKGEGKWNQQKIAAVFGDEKAARIMETLGNAKSLRENFNRVVQGSKTAETQAKPQGGGVAAKVADYAMSGAADLAGGGGFATGSKALVDMKNFILQKLEGGAIADPALSAEAARVLTIDDPQKVIRLARILASKEGPGATGQVSPLIAALLARQEEMGNR